MKRILSYLLTAAVLLCCFSAFSWTAIAAKPEIWDGKRATGFAGGSGTAEDPWQISNGKELAYMQYLFCNTVLKDWLPYNEIYGIDHFVLTNDIYLNDVSNFDTWGLKDKAPKNQWTKAIGRNGYALSGGVLDGQGHTIFGMYQVTDEFGGLISVCNGGTVKNLNMDKCMVYASDGGILGGLSDEASSIVNCRISGKMIGYNTPGDHRFSVGGIVGDFDGGLIENCVFSGTVTAEREGCGGIAGRSGRGGNAPLFVSTIRGCINYGTVSSTNDAVGGIIGLASVCSNSTRIENCLNAGDISGRAYVGGLVGSGGDCPVGKEGLFSYEVKEGRTPVTEIKNSLSVGKVTAKTDKTAGGLVGWSVKTITKVTNSYYDTDRFSGSVAGKNEAGLSGGGLPTAKLSGKGAVSTMKLDGGVWQDVDGYYPVLKALHAKGWTVIGKLGGNDGSSGSGGATSGTPNTSGSHTPGTPNGSVNASAGTPGNSTVGGGDSVTTPDASVEGDGQIVPPDTSGTDIVDTEDNGATADRSDTDTRHGGLTWLWIVPGVAALGAGSVCIYLFVIRKKQQQKGEIQ